MKTVDSRVYQGKFSQKFLFPADWDALILVQPVRMYSFNSGQKSKMGYFKLRAKWQPYLTFADKNDAHLVVYDTDLFKAPFVPGIKKIKKIDTNENNQNKTTTNE